MVGNSVIGIGRHLVDFVELIGQFGLNLVHVLRFPADLFNEDTYYVSIWLTTWLPHAVHQVQENVMNIQIMDDLASSTRSPSHYVIKGALRPRFQWDIIPL